jgi:hypothetical protein
MWGHGTLYVSFFPRFFLSSRLGPIPSALSSRVLFFLSPSFLVAKTVC